MQDAVRLFASERRVIQKAEGFQAGILTSLYDHDSKSLENSLTYVQHHHTNVIYSTVHFHLSMRERLEAVAVKGETHKIRKLDDELASKKGVKILRSTIITV